jgi:hypothetical protein
MPAPPLTQTLHAAAASPFFLRPWRDRWALEQNPQAVHFAQSAAGKALLLACFAGVAPLAGLSPVYVLFAAAFAWWPAYRNWVLLAAAATALVRRPDVWVDSVRSVLAQEGLSGQSGALLALGALAVYFGCAWAALAQVRRAPGCFLARRPVVSLLAATALLSVLATSPLLHGMPRAAAWCFLSVYCAYLWCLAYGLLDQRSRSHGPLAFQMGILQPFWRSATWSYTAPTPLGKGAAFLRKHQAKSAEELAVTQLKALKLLVWTFVLIGLHAILSELLEVRLGVPSPAVMKEAFMRGEPYPRATNWAGLVWATAESALLLAIWGHKAIAVARLAGFRLPRNTWRPLEALTLAEFWNRYYYYFKELLVEFFFLPTFLRAFRQHPRLRVFFATFMAAGVGNALYHFIRDLHYVASMGWRGALTSFTSYLFYCVVLATGIGISQARTNAGRKLPTTWSGRLGCVLSVWFFFVCLYVFGDESRNFAFGDRVSFFLSLFGAN